MFLKLSSVKERKKDKEKMDDNILLVLFFVLVIIFPLVFLLVKSWTTCGCDNFATRTFERYFNKEEFTNDEKAMKLLKSPSLHPFPELVVRDWPERKGFVFLSIASFQDERCRLSIVSAFKNAEDPKKIVIGICEQNAEGQDACCSNFVQDGEIRLISIPAKQATGPCTARQKVSTLWRGEEIYCQVDAHTYFCKGWDKLALEMWEKRPSPLSVFSTYANDSNKEEEKMHERTIPIINKGWFTNSHSFVQRAEISHKPGIYSTTRGIGGGFLVTHGRVLYDVPLDPTLSGLFQGEETLWGGRMYTHGYDLFSPSYSLFCHNYKRKRQGAPIHQSGINFKEGELHCWALLREEQGNKRAELSKKLGYGFGAKRTIKDFFKSVNIDPSGEVGKDKQGDWESSDVLSR